jgi:hypothetical protein
MWTFIRCGPIFVSKNLKANVIFISKKFESNGEINSTRDQFFAKNANNGEFYLRKDQYSSKRNYK